MDRTNDERQRRYIARLKAAATRSKRNRKKDVSGLPARDQVNMMIGWQRDDIERICDESRAMFAHPDLVAEDQDAPMTEAIVNHLYAQANKLMTLAQELDDRAWRSGGR